MRPPLKPQPVIFPKLGLPRRPRGYHLTLDGPRGVGTTTVARQVCELLGANSLPFTAVAEPSDSEEGRALRKNPDRYSGLRMAERLAADRHDQERVIVRPSLARGATVVSDGHIASCLVYQRIDAANLEDIWRVHEPWIVPDLCVVLKADPSVLAVRRRRSGIAQTYLDVLGNHTHMETVYFDDAVEWLRLKRIPVMVIDTSIMTPDGVAARIVMEADIVVTPRGPVQV
ncbi:dTMP kinase [Streptomyces endophyticus]|uniref:Thymidylate kinase-like domain-containing protein n=1 Tax=Streptomyces endophyticus TaxID=714166 RepID=A0ABU6F1X5_9ACTN|nr:hypothetical protein [Streptomyces endophyticus]MEB8338015.1 hypothetical protein [Streptomyces endophyticus]